MEKSYADLFDVEPKLRPTSADIVRQRKALEQGKSVRVSRFKDHAIQHSDRLR